MQAGRVICVRKAAVWSKSVDGLSWRDTPTAKKLTSNKQRAHDPA